VEVQQVRSEQSRYGEWLNLPLREVLKFYDKIEAIPNEGIRRNNRRRLILNDVFYLLVRVCGRKDMIHPWLYDRCREVQKSPDGHLDLWARDSYKSTIITFGMTIQDVLSDPETTILLFSHTKDIAQTFLKQIMNELDSNEELKSHFPNVLWQSARDRNMQKRKIKWSEKDGLVVRRLSNPREPTIFASGLVDGMPTSFHVQRLVYDDTVTPASVSTPEQIKKTTSMLELSDNLGSGARTIKRMIGTRYHLFDTYHDVIERGLFKVRCYPATSDGSDDCSKSVLLPPEVLAKKKITQGHNFYAQMLLNPRADSIAGFDAKNLRYWPAVHFKNLNRIILVDPSSGKHREQNKGDFTAMWCMGKGADEKKYGIKLIRDRLTGPQRIEALFQMVADYRVRLVFYEETGSYADIENIRLEQNRRNFRFDLIPIGVKGVKKKERILRLQSGFASGDIYLPERDIYINQEGVAVDVIKQFVQDEYIPYPVVSHDDALDALAMMEHEDVVRRWITPLSEHIDENPMLVKARREARRARRPDSWMAG
jgi:hypothetical protein